MTARHATSSEALQQAWMDAMRGGDFAAAWSASDTLLHCRGGQTDHALPRHVQSIWTGAPVDGARVLVRCYHGLGDTLQFIRYVPELRRRAREVIVWAQPSLLPLLTRVHGIDRLLRLHDGAPDVQYDVDVEVMELPYLFRTTIDTIPAAVPYIRVPPVALDRRRGPAVGLVWAAGDWAPHRTVPFAALRPLLDAPVTWHVLQGGPALAERPDGFGIVCGQDMVSAATVVASLDLLITVDSMPAHLAGALATPVWTMLPHDCDWRWMRDRDDSPWYPTMRLWRQAEGEEGWTPVLERMAAALRRCVSQPGLAGRGSGFGGQWPACPP